MITDDENIMTNQSYAVVTVAKNEGKYISDTILSIINQSILPEYYMIIDDGSTDSTPAIIDKYEKEFSWIKHIRLSPSKWDIGVHYAYICRCGFDAVLDLCHKNNTNIEYICLIDADTIIEKDYFKKVFYKFSMDSNYGIVSGGVYHKQNEKYVYKHSRFDFPSGTARCWRMKCFEHTGGYILDITPDYVSNIRSKGMGWITLRCPEILIVEQRPTGYGSLSFWGYANMGYFDYHLYINPVLILAKFLRFVVNKKSINVYGYIYGYLSSIIRRKKIIDDKYVRSYCMNGALKDMYKLHIVNSLKNGDNWLKQNENLIMDEIEAKYFKSISHD